MSTRIKAAQLAERSKNFILIVGALYLAYVLINYGRETMTRLLK